MIGSLILACLMIIIFIVSITKIGKVIHVNEYFANLKAIEQETHILKPLQFKSVDSNSRNEYFDREVMAEFPLYIFIYGISCGKMAISLNYGFDNK